MFHYEKEGGGGGGGGTLRFESTRCLFCVSLRELKIPTENRNRKNRADRIMG